MAFFKRRNGGDPIGAFWSWWSDTGASLVTGAIARQNPESIVGELSKRLGEIDKGLDWELGPGLHAENVLIVTAAGDPERRAVARRWLRGAPPSDPVWEYADLRRPAPDAVLQLAGAPAMTVTDAVVTIEPDTASAAVHVGVHHPAFPELTENLQRTATFLLLDAVLGEELVETWIGAIDTLIGRPAEAVPIDALLPAVAAFAAGHSAADGTPMWRLLESRSDDGTRIVASAEIPLRPIRLPHLDTHVGVSVRFDEAGLPVPAALDQLRFLEDHLSARLGDSGRLLAHETSSGARLFHFYVDGRTPAADQLQAAVTGWEHGPVELSVTPDAAWEQVGHLR